MGHKNLRTHTLSREKPSQPITAAESIKAKSFTIDGEAVVLGRDGLSRFEELSSREAARTAILYAFDLIEYDGEDLRNLPLFLIVGGGKQGGRQLSGLKGEEFLRPTLDLSVVTGLTPPRLCSAIRPRGRA
jgi:hypothetical protein